MPQIISTAIIAATAATGFAAFAITAATYVATTLVTSWALTALSPKPSFGVANSRGLLVNARDPISAQDFVYGKVRKGGIISYLEVTDSPSTTNGYLHQIITLCGHTVNSVGDIYINDEVVTLDSNGFVTSSPWNSKIRVKKYTGSQTTTDPSLLAESSVINSSFVGRETAYLYVRFEFDPEVFANGVPLITAVVEGKMVYDPRTATTAYSDNAALCVRDFLVSTYGLNDQNIDDTVFSAAANICDEVVVLAVGGNEKRYTLNGVISAEAAFGEILQTMMTSCAGNLFWGGGKWKLVVGDYIAPTKTLTLDDLRSEISVQTRTNLRDQFNIVQGTFSDASKRWITVDYPSTKQRNVGLGFITEDNNIESFLDLSLPFTTSSATAQRLSKLTLFRGREQMTLSADFGLNAFDVEVGEIIALTLSRYGWTAKEFEVQGWNFYVDANSGDIKIGLVLREISSTAFDWDAEEEAIAGNNTNLTPANLAIWNASPVSISTQLSDSVVETDKIADSAVNTVKVATESISATRYSLFSYSSLTSVTENFNITFPFSGTFIAIVSVGRSLSASGYDSTTQVNQAFSLSISGTTVASSQIQLDMLAFGTNLTTGVFDITSSGTKSAQFNYSVSKVSGAGTISGGITQARVYIFGAIR